MKQKPDSRSAVQDLCAKLKIQLDELAVSLEKPDSTEELEHRAELMERLKRQLNELSL